SLGEHTHPPERQDRVSCLGIAYLQHTANVFRTDVADRLLRTPRHAVVFAQLQHAHVARRGVSKSFLRNAHRLRGQSVVKILDTKLDRLDFSASNVAEVEVCLPYTLVECGVPELNSLKVLARGALAIEV